MAQSKSTKTIPVWMGAGKNAVSVNRCDNQEWEHPLFVNAPAGFREDFLIPLLKKDENGVNTQTVRWEMPVSMIKRSIIKSGEHAGEPCFSVTIKDDENFESFCEMLAATARPKGFVEPKRRAMFNRILANLPDDTVDLSTLESF